MTTICAWCGALMAGSPPKPGETVSHGCCLPCSERIAREDPLVKGGQGRSADDLACDYWGCVIVAAAALATAVILIVIACMVRAHAHV